MHTLQSVRSSAWRCFLISSFEISSSITVGVLEHHPAGSWTMHLDFLYVQTKIWDLSCILDSALLSSCHTLVSQLAGNGCDWHRAAWYPSHTGHSQHPCIKSLTDVLNTGSTAENCSFLSAFQLCPKYHGDVDVTGRSRTRMRHTWNFQILEKTFAKTNRGKVMWQHLE